MIFFYVHLLPSHTFFDLYSCYLRDPLIISVLPLPRRRESSNVKSLWVLAFEGMKFLEVALKVKFPNTNI
jgi:hypothetical protein